MADPWRKLHDRTSYKIFRSAGNWLTRLIDRYTVVAPNGGILGLAATMRGARRLIRRDQRKRNRRPWWEEPIVKEVPTDG